MEVERKVAAVRGCRQVAAGARLAKCSVMMSELITLSSPCWPLAAANCELLLRSFALPYVTHGYTSYGRSLLGSDSAARSRALPLDCLYRLALTRSSTHHCNTRSRLRCYCSAIEGTARCVSDEQLQDAIVRACSG